MTLSSQEKLSLLSNMATMLGAGIPILEVVNSLLEDTVGHQRYLLSKLRDDLIQGKKVADSLQDFPDIFDNITINLLRASEEAGTLETTLRDLRDHTQVEMEFMDKIKFAMLYPIVILLVFAAVLAVTLFFVVPRISSVFLRLKVELPLPTKILIWLSQTLTNYWTLVVIMSAVIIITGVWLYKKNKRMLAGLGSHLPLVGPLIRLIDFTQFSRSMYLLLASGLPILSALGLAVGVVVDPQVARLIGDACEMVMAGKPLSEGLRRGRGIAPVLLLKLTEAGERTGTLDKSMQEVSKHLDYEVSNTLKTVTALLEPIMLVAVGVSVGGMMLAIIAPIYGLIGQV